MLKSIFLLAALSALQSKAESIVTIYDMLHFYVNDTTNGTLRQVHVSDTIYSFPWNVNVTHIL